MVSPITLAVVSEDGRGTSARLEIVEAARGVMQLAGRSGDVRSWRQSGRHMLVWSFSAFDPGCVKTCTSQECAELFSLSSSLSSGRKHFWFSNLRNRDGISTRRLNVGVFTRPRPIPEIGGEAPARFLLGTSAQSAPGRAELRVPVYRARLRQ